MKREALAAGLVSAIKQLSVRFARGFPAADDRDELSDQIARFHPE